MVIPKIQIFHAPLNLIEILDSFGILLWEIITLRVPFESIQTIEEFQHEVVQCHQRPNLSYVKSENLRALLKKCWDPEPMQRPSFQEIREELELFIKAHEEKNSTNQNEKKQGPRRINSFLRRFSMGKEHQVSET
jgi:serine/threonine protein kinase